MKSTYLKPQMFVAEIEAEYIMNSLSVSQEGHSGEFRSKERGSDEEELWGNENSKDWNLGW